MGTASERSGRQIALCVWCEQEIELASDGAWQTTSGGSCGCTKSPEQGGDGEHEPDRATILTMTGGAG